MLYVCIAENLATHSYRLATGDEVILLGEKEQYEPRCRSCYDQGKYFTA